MCNLFLPFWNVTSVCIENGVSPVVLQKILGHKDIQVTLNTYTDVFNEFKEKEIEKIDDFFNK